MKNILLIGAGRSANTLIKFLLSSAESEDWQINVADQDHYLAESKVKGHPRGKAVHLNIFNEGQLFNFLEENDLVISMVPAHLHLHVAKACIDHKKSLVTASYLTEEMKQLDQAARNAGVILLNEMGLDPGIDHMSAMEILDNLKTEGVKIHGFESFTGGLVAPENDDNPWHYKFTWNPRNVVLAGSGGTVKFIHENMYKYIPYHQVFKRTENIDIEGFGRFEGYANRDSLKYRSVYGLEDIATLYRGTLRRKGYSSAWNVFVQLGMTDDSYVLENTDKMTHRDFINTFLAYHPTDSVELKLMHYLNIPQDNLIMEKLEWLGLFSEDKIELKNGTPAQILQYILEKSWLLRPEEKDMVVMYHRFEFFRNGKKHLKESSMVKIGENQDQTAMAQTVGLPIGIAVKLILNGTLNLTGVHIPIKKEVYQPVLKELKAYGISFTEKESVVD